jgi:hypothetical protein
LIRSNKGFTHEISSGLEDKNTINYAEMENGYLVPSVGSEQL